MKVFQIDGNARYFNIGVEEEGELCHVDVNLIRTPHNWGAVLVCPNGKTISNITNYEDDTVKITLDYKNDTIQFEMLLNTDTNMYEILVDD